MAADALAMCVTCALAAIKWAMKDQQVLTFLEKKHLEMHRCALNTVAIDVLVLKHQTISIHSADKIFIILVSYWSIIFIGNSNGK